MRVIAGETTGWRNLEVFVDGGRVLAMEADDEAGYAIVPVLDLKGRSVVGRRPGEGAFPLRARVEGHVEIRQREAE